MSMATVGIDHAKNIFAVLGWYGYGKYQDRLKIQHIGGTEVKSFTSAPATSLKI